VKYSKANKSKKTTATPTTQKKKQLQLDGVFFAAFLTRFWRVFTSHIEMLREFSLRSVHIKNALRLNMA